MIDPVPEQWELTSFFEAEPEVADPEYAPLYSLLTFRTEVAPNFRIRCEIEIASEIVRIEWRQNDEQLLALDLHWVQTMALETHRGVETMVLTFADPRVDRLTWRIRPSPALRWGIPMYP